MSLSLIGHATQEIRPFPGSSRAVRADQSEPVQSSEDSVVLGSLVPASSTGLAKSAAPEKTREIRGTVDLKPADLFKALKNSKAREILEAREVLEAIDPKASLTDLSSALFNCDSAAADDSVLQLKYYRIGPKCNVTLTSTRQMSNGNTVYEVQSGTNTNQSAHQAPEPRVSVRYEPETFPTYQQLPDALKNAWSTLFPDSFQEFTREDRELIEGIGEISGLRMILEKDDKDQPYLIFDWMGKNAEGVKTSVRKGSRGQYVSVSLTPDQLKTGKHLPEPVKNGWSIWGLQPAEMAERMVQGASVRPGQLEVEVSLGQNRDKITLGASLKGDVEGKELDAGQVTFSFYNSTDKDGKVNRVAYHSLMDFKKEFQGQGWPKQFCATISMYTRR